MAKLPPTGVRRAAFPRSPQPETLLKARLAYLSRQARETPMTYPTYHNLIGGEWIPAKSGKTAFNVNPADHSDIVGAFPALRRRRR